MLVRQYDWPSGTCVSLTILCAVSGSLDLCSWESWSHLDLFSILNESFHTIYSNILSQWWNLIKRLYVSLFNFTVCGVILKDSDDSSVPSPVPGFHTCPFSLCLRMFPLHFLCVVTATSTLYAPAVFSMLPFGLVHHSRSCFLCCQSPSRSWTLSILEFLPTCFPFWSFLSKMFTEKHSFSSAPTPPPWNSPGRHVTSSLFYWLDFYFLSFFHFGSLN